MKSILSVACLSLLAATALPLSACVAPPLDDPNDNAERVGEADDALTTHVADTQISGQQSQDGPSLTMFNDANAVVMVHRGASSNNLYMATFDGLAWSSNTQIPGQTSSVKVALSQHNDHQIHMVRRCGTSTSLCYAMNGNTNATNWAGLETLSYQSNLAPALASDPDSLDLVLVFLDQASGALHFAKKDTDWRAPFAVPLPSGASGFAAKTPALAVHLGHLHMVFETNTGFLAHTTFNGTSWATPTSIIETERSSPALASYNGLLYLFHRRSTDNSIWWSSSPTGNVNTWTSDVSFPGSGSTQDTPGLVTFGLQMVLAHMGSSTSQLYYSTYLP